jgi:hypothetical protein
LLPPLLHCSAAGSWVSFLHWFDPLCIAFFSFQIEGYVAGFGNPDWKRTHAAASRTAVAVTNLLKQGATCVGRTVMDELGFGFVLSSSILLDWNDLLLFRIVGARLLEAVLTILETYRCDLIMYI